MNTSVHRYGYVFVASILMIAAAGQGLAQAASETSEDAYVEALPVIGEAEHVVIEPEGIVLKARIDTGAKTSSMGVEKLDEFERDGKPWVRFIIKRPENGEAVQFTLPIERISKIKRHGGEAQRRPVVILHVVLGSIDHKREFTLTDRSGFEYPVLLGRNYLMDAAVVDVSRKFTVKAPKVRK